MEQGGKYIDVAVLMPAQVGEFRKSSRCSHGDCTEVAALAIGGTGVAVGDSSDPQGPKLGFSGSQWNAFTGRLKKG